VPNTQTPNTPVVLVHGGGLAGSCWEPMLPFVGGPVIAVDLPGRGAHPADLDAVTIADAARSIVDDVDRAAFDDVVLVAHSLGGCSMPATIALLGDRARHVVFVACTVPPDGRSAYDTLDPEVTAKAREGGILGDHAARDLFGNDLDDEQFAWFEAHQVPEAAGLVHGPVDLAPLAAPIPRTWVRTLRDNIVAAEKQLRFVDNVGGQCRVVDLDVGHMCMISAPGPLAEIVNDVAARSASGDLRRSRP
jgi:pimeloyl-ACP methyl ester carboxylesterase